MRVLAGREPAQLTVTESCQELVESACASQGAGILPYFRSSARACLWGLGEVSGKEASIRSLPGTSVPPPFLLIRITWALKQYSFWADLGVHYPGGGSSITYLFLGSGVFNCPASQSPGLVN